MGGTTIKEHQGGGKREWMEKGKETKHGGQKVSWGHSGFSMASLWFLELVVGGWLLWALDASKHDDTQLYSRQLHYTIWCGNLD